MAFPFFSNTCLRQQSSATSVFPLAVGLAKTRFLHSNAPARMASSCGGYNSVIPLWMMSSLSSSGIASSAIFTWVRHYRVFLLFVYGLCGFKVFICCRKLFWHCLWVVFGCLVDAFVYGNYWKSKLIPFYTLSVLILYACSLLRFFFYPPSFCAGLVLGPFFDLEF